MRGRLVGSVPVLLLLLPSAHAVMVPRVLMTFAELTQNSMIVFGLSFLLVFMLLYAIFAAGLAKVKPFQGDHKLTKNGKIVAVAMAMLATLAIFYGFGTRAAYALTDILAPFGIFGGLAIALVVFCLVYFGFREEGEHGFLVALAAAGLAMIIAGAITSHPNISSWGWIIAAIAAAILLLFTLFHAIGGHGEHGERDHPSHEPEHPAHEGEHPAEEHPPGAETPAAVRDEPRDATELGGDFTAEISGVVIADTRNPVLDQATGEQINTGLVHGVQVSVPRGPHTVGALAQLDGRVYRLTEQQFNSPRFTLRFRYPREPLQAPTLVFQRSDGLSDLNLVGLQPGLIVYLKRRGFGTVVLYDYHIAAFPRPVVHRSGESQLGRGGEGNYGHPDNPRSDAVHHGLQFSGVPIVLTHTHHAEANVVIPVVPETVTPQPAPTQQPTIREALQQLAELYRQLTLPEHTFREGDLRKDTLFHWRAENIAQDPNYRKLREIQTIISAITTQIRRIAELRDRVKEYPEFLRALTALSAATKQPLIELTDLLGAATTAYEQHADVPTECTPQRISELTARIAELLGEFLEHAPELLKQSGAPPQTPAAIPRMAAGAARRATVSPAMVQPPSVPPPQPPPPALTKGSFDVAVEVTCTPEYRRKEIFIEDCALANGAVGTILAADGVGSHIGGAEASTIVAWQVYYAAPHIPRTSQQSALAFCEDIVSRARQQVETDALQLKPRWEEFRAAEVAAGRRDPGEFSNPATTLSWATLIPENGTWWVVGINIGDSRLYLRRADGSVEQLSKDDSWVQEQVEGGKITAEEAEVHTQRNVITKAIGMPSLSLETHNVILKEVSPDDIVIAMSDGVSDNLGQKRIVDIGGKCDTPEGLVGHYVDEALAESRKYDPEKQRRGESQYAKPDDISCAAIRVPPIPIPSTPAGAAPPTVPSQPAVQATAAASLSQPAPAAHAMARTVQLSKAVQQHLQAFAQVAQDSGLLEQMQQMHRDGKSPEVIAADLGIPRSLKYGSASREVRNAILAGEPAMFVRAVLEWARVSSTATAVAPPTAMSPADVEEYLQSNTFIQRDSGDAYVLKSIARDGKKITLQKKSAKKVTITLQLNSFLKNLRTPGGTWRVQ